MCKCANKLLCILPLVWLAATLTACGGAASGDGDSTTSTINKPTISSIAASSIMEQSSSSSQSSNAEPTSTSSISQSSSSVYSRIPRSSSASVSSQSNGYDTTPPTVTELHLYRLSERSITLIWDDAMDNVGISHYTIKRDNKLIAIVDYPAQMFADQNLLPATDYTYAIAAFDTAGNDSGDSMAFSIRTLALANSSTASTNSSASAKSSSSLHSSLKSSSSSLRSSSSSKSSTSMSSSSRPNSSASSQSSSAFSSASSKSSSASSTASSAAIETITITWGHPNQREDGSYLELEDIGGYEIRYRKPTGARYTYINLNGNRTTEYIFTGPVRDLEFEIAVFDTTGLYSRYIKITR
ncbi:fibronectin type III domain-containing protein [Cellvibrio fibrivorans]|uniref:Fibronectin type-III domain-containing protein n=1 Tax=Cellvibrio fibrivorans TaxID=126350 RepID=A0ABU1UU38_9GAMM|nr:fibronectin type III domain-containing protein [Cellvibrio fibrivorans]MDR7088648.1 hypothetical protein [Cellvibrio fibrivorans]